MVDVRDDTPLEAGLHVVRVHRKAGARPDTRGEKQNLRRIENRRGNPSQHPKRCEWRSCLRPEGWRRKNMPEWRMTGIYFKSCNCEPGCPCDFMSPPTYHECESVLGMKVDEGAFDDISLSGVKWTVSYYWPGPLHEGNGIVKPYFDEAMSQEQIDALGQILMGQTGGG